MNTRGFPPDEYHARLSRAQRLMQKADLAALLLTCEADFRYFTGFLTRFWESPTRPWFLVVPATGMPIAVIPSIGAPLMASTWIDDTRTWRAPDYTDDGIGLLADTLREVARSGRIGLPMGLESHVRMPLADWTRLNAEQDLNFTDDTCTMHRLRAIKSEREIAHIRTTCAIADRTFARVPEFARPGTPLREVFRQFQIAALKEGADWVPYLAGGAGQGGYGDVISPPGGEPLAPGDVLMIDTGLLWDGYFCDFERNFSLGPPGQDVAEAHAKLIDAVDAAADVAHVGATASDLFHAMDAILTGGQGSDAGRLGHGLGMQLTEGLSLIADDQTVLKAGMVLTLEPGVEVSAGRIMVHEEDIVIRAGGPEFLSTRSPREIAVLDV